MMNNNGKRRREIMDPVLSLLLENTPLPKDLLTEILSFYSRGEICRRFSFVLNDILSIGKYTQRCSECFKRCKRRPRYAEEWACPVGIFCERHRHLRSESPYKVLVSYRQEVWNCRKSRSGSMCVKRLGVRSDSPIVKLMT